MAVDEYRRHAMECLLLLTHMAEAWLRLAHQAEKNLTIDLVYGTPPQRERPVLQQQQQRIRPKQNPTE